MSDTVFANSAIHFEGVLASAGSTQRERIEALRVATSARTMSQLDVNERRKAASPEGEASAAAATKIARSWLGDPGATFEEKSIAKAYLDAIGVDSDISEAMQRKLSSMRGPSARPLRSIMETDSKETARAFLRARGLLK